MDEVVVDGVSITIAMNYRLGERLEAIAREQGMTSNALVVHWLELGLDELFDFGFHTGELSPDAVDKEWEKWNAAGRPLLGMNRNDLRLLIVLLRWQFARALKARRGNSKGTGVVFLTWMLGRGLRVVKVIDAPSIEIIDGMSAA